MKRLTALLTVLLFILAMPAVSVFSQNEAPAPSIKSEAAIVLEQSTGKILYEKNTHAKMYPASLTKNMTALLAIENMDPDQKAVIGDELDLVSKDASIGGLRKTMELTINELLWALMLPSGNDAAYTIAVQTARAKSGNPSMSVKDAVSYFVDMMNKRASEIGCKDSHFANPDGYHDENHYSSAFDEALIARETMKSELFRKIVSSTTFTIENLTTVKNGKVIRQLPMVWKNRNELLNKQSPFYYDYATGIKTGHTSQAGYCLSSAASKDGMDLIAIVLKSPTEDDRWLDSRALLNYGYDNFKIYNYFKKDQTVTPVVIDRGLTGPAVQINAVSPKDFSDVLNTKDINNIERKIEWNKKLLISSGNEGGAKLKAPVEKGQVIGDVKFLLNGNVIAQSELIAAESVKRGSLWNAIGYIAQKIYEERLPIAAALVVAALVVIVLKVLGRRRR